MSGYGYSYPDSSFSCYIGFHYGSPSLSAASFRGYAVLGRDVITTFYYYALNQSMTIHDSLNSASLATFGVTFTDSPLYRLGGYETYWPVYVTNGPGPGWKPGIMRVYGNSNLYLSDPPIFTEQLSVQSSAGGSAYSPRYLYPEDEVAYVYASPAFGYVLSGWTVDQTYIGQPYTNPLTVAMDGNHTVTAHFASGDFLSMWAFQGIYGTQYVDVYVYGEYAGNTEYSIPFTFEEHAVSVPPYIYDSQANGWYHFQFLGVMNSYDGTYITTYAANPAVIDMSVFQQYDRLFVAVYSFLCYLPPINLTVQCIGGGHVESYSNYPVYPTGYIIPQYWSDYINAVADEGYQFDYWELDSYYAGTNPTITIDMNTEHTLIAHFTSI
jgi:hypothetical protein